MNGPQILYSCKGGDIVLPASDLVLVDREDGGNLIVNTPRSVWECSLLSPEELASWSYLVAATGEAMAARLPRLEGGCINYWEAGNWALNPAAAPEGAEDGFALSPRPHASSREKPVRRQSRLGLGGSAALSRLCRQARMGSWQLPSHRHELLVDKYAWPHDDRCLPGGASFTALPWSCGDSPRRRLHWSRRCVRLV